MSEELPLPVPPSKGEEVPITESKPASISLEGTPETKTDKAPTDNYASSDSYSSSPRTDDEDDEDYDDGSVIMYKIEVQEAIKMDTHTGYKLLITPSRGKPYTVVHRYSDFHQLQEKLVASYPFVTSYPFPSKKIFNKEKEFIEKRKQDLQMWINKVVDNVNLINSRDVRAFLDIKDRDHGKPVKSGAYKDPTLVIDVESTKQVDDADKAIREKLKEWRDQLRESKETAALRENLEERLIEEAKALACRQKIEALKRGAIVSEQVLKGKPTRIALRLNSTESELRFGPFTGDTMPECDVLAKSMSLLDVDRVVVGADVPMVQKNKKQNSAVSFALVSNLPEPPVHALTNGVAALSAAEYTDCVDGIRALLGKPFVMRSTVEALVYVDINLRLMELTEAEVAANLATAQPLPPLPTDFEFPE